MPAVFHRLNDSLVEVLPTYPENLPMSGRYVIDYPDHFNLDLTTPTPSRGDVISKVSDLYREKFVAFDYFITNNLWGSFDFTNSFSDDPTLNVSLVTNQYLPVSPANPEYNFRNSFKRGSKPNTVSVLGRFPQMDKKEGGLITSDQSLAGNRCIITQDIDISGSTSDGLGRTDFFVYFRSALKTYTKDRSLSDTERNAVSPLTANRKGDVSYTHTQYDSEYRLRCFISGDGSSYQEIENLKVYSFNGRVDTIRLAWLNYTDADLTLLSYTLMY